MDRCPAQQVDDWNRRMAPMVDVVLTMADGRDLPGTLDGQAYLSADAAFVRVRRPTGWRPATFVADLSRVRPMTDADRARFGIADVVVP